MLARLHVRNYVLIDSLEIDFPEGLIIITGQTGAGKSILMGALSLIMGAKADSSMIGAAADNCVIEAEFETPDRDGALHRIMDENDVEWSDHGIIIRRVVSASGRSRAFVNDCPVSVQVLQALSQHLVDIHSQHQTMLLSDKQYQLDMLDSFAGAWEMRKSLEDAWKALQSCRSALREMEGRMASASADYAGYIDDHKRMTAAALTEGELAELESELQTLSNAEEIKSSLCSVEELISSSSYEGTSMDSALKEAAKLLSKVSIYLSDAASLSERVDSCRAEINDILSDVSRINSGIDLSEARLQQVEDRIALIYDLMRRYGCADEAELIAFGKSLEEKVRRSNPEDMELERQELIRQEKAAQAEVDRLCASLHSCREKAVLEFAGDILKSLHQLELPHSVFNVQIQDKPQGPSGADAVQFMFSSTGHNPVDVAKCASGGEKSRIMLALKALMARYTEMPTMIFDEIDTGVSGSVADSMGTMICTMGEHMQVFAITHLPQVAAKGTAHYLVSKEMDTATCKAVSTITRLSEDQRVSEVARMLSGAVLTEAAMANARELLGF